VEFNPRQLNGAQTTPQHISKRKSQKANIIHPNGGRPTTPTPHTPQGISQLDQRRPPTAGWIESDSRNRKLSSEVPSLAGCTMSFSTFGSSACVRIAVQGRASQEREMREKHVRAKRRQRLRMETRSAHKARMKTNRKAMRVKSPEGQRPNTATKQCV
jgi:hypothetical protein